MRRLFVYISTACLIVVVLYQRGVATQIDTVKELAPGVYFHEGDLRGRGHCNNGWVVFRDYVLVLDANFPSGAREIIPKIRAQTDKPIRFAFDTHHHGDHAYGNQVWAEQYDGAVGDVFAVQDKIASGVLAAIEPQLYAAENAFSQRRPPESIDAWGHAMRAMAHVAQRQRDARSEFP